jgi:glycyl-tRNA synthetase beta subunit
MKDKTINEVNDLISDINNPDIDKKTQAIRLSESDPLFSLKIELSNFFKNRLNRIIEEDGFKSKVKDAILEKIENDEFSPSQLMSLYSSINNVSNNSIDSILDIFKPSKDGIVSPIFKDKEKANEIPYGDIEPDKAEALNKLSELVEAIYQQANSDDTSVT